MLVDGGKDDPYDHDVQNLPLLANDHLPIQELYHQDAILPVSLQPVVVAVAVAVAQ